MLLARYEPQFVNWLDGLCPWQLAVTFKLMRHDAHWRPFNERVVASTANYLANAMSRAAFGRKQRDQGYQVGVVFAFGLGVYCDKPHLHASVAFPSLISEERRRGLIDEAASRAGWIDGLPHIQLYRDQGWQSYMVGHGSEKVLLDLIRLPNPV